MNEGLPKTIDDRYFCPCCKQFLPASFFNQSALLCDDCFILQVTRDRKAEIEQEEDLER